MFQYSSGLGKCAIVHLQIDENISELKSREVCSYLRGTTWAAPVNAQWLLNKIKAHEVAYAKPVVYLNSADAPVLFQKQLNEDIHIDKMPEAARKSYLPHEVTICKTPLEVISAATPNAQSFGLVHVLPHMKKLLNQPLGEDGYNSVVVFINCFEKMPEFIDLSICIS